MAELKGTVLASRIVPSDSLDTYATHDADYGRGGYRSVSDITERDAITLPRRKLGMKVFVNDTQTEYQLVGGLENTNWEEVVSGSGSTDVCSIDDEVTYIEDADFLVLCRQGVNYKVKASVLKEYMLIEGDIVSYNGITVTYNGEQVIYN